MKLLLDANLPYKLTNILSPIFGECFHVDNIGLNVPAKDTEIWSYALENNCIIVSKDNDFIELLEQRGFPPKIVLLKIGNSNNKILAEALIKAKEAIFNLATEDYGLLEVYS
jgi:predicted nuclease of predicted toxin-antitoxin system